MRRTRTLEPTFDNTRNRWKVDVPASASDTGKRYRAWFETRKAARKFLGDSSSDSGISIPPSLAMDADTARQRIDAAGLDLTLAEVAAAYVEAVKELSNVGTLIDAARAFRERHDARAASKTLGDAVAAFFAAKEGTIRPRTEQSYRYTLEKTIESLNTVPLSDITSASLSALLADRKPTSRAVHVRNLRVFWTWASKEPREWAGMATVNALEFRKDSPDADISILRPADVQALLATAEGFSPNAAIAFSIAIFAGVRQAELEKLTWADVRDEHIEIGASVAKKGKRRLIPISPTLRAWLDTYMPINPDKEDFIVGANWTRVSCAVRRLAGWDVVALLLENPPEPTRGRWPANAPRHTCASLLVATGEPLETLIFQFGHSGGHDLLRRHYVGRLSKKDAIAILKITPSEHK